MNKIGIVTIYDLTNYGNRLQNYAVKQILERITGKKIPYFLSFNERMTM